MSVIYKSKDGSNENELIIEQCTLEKRCNALTTFIQHVGFSNNQYLEGIHLFDMDTGEENKHENLVFKLPRKKGNFIILNFCPFCGGCVNQKAHKRKIKTKDGEKVDIDMTFKYEPFTEEDYKKVYEAMEKRRKEKEAQGDN